MTETVERVVVETTTNATTPSPSISVIIHDKPIPEKKAPELTVESQTPTKQETLAPSPSPSQSNLEKIPKPLPPRTNRLYQRTRTVPREDFVLSSEFLDRSGLLIPGALQQIKAKYGDHQNFPGSAVTNALPPPPKRPAPNFASSQNDIDLLIKHIRDSTRDHATPRPNNSEHTKLRGDYETLKDDKTTIAKLSIPEQNKFLRKHFLLLFIVLFITVTSSYYLIEFHIFKNWIEAYPWILYIMAGVIGVVFLLYAIPCIKTKTAYSFRCFLYACVCLCWIVIVTVIGTYVESGLLFRVVGIVTIFVFLMFLYSLQPWASFSKVLAYGIIVTISLVSLFVIVYIPNREYLGTIPSRSWLTPPGGVVDVVITITLSAYCCYTFVKNVPIMMETKTKDDCLETVISAFIGVVTVFFSGVITVMFASSSRMSRVSENF